MHLVGINVDIAIEVAKLTEKSADGGALRCAGEVWLNVNTQMITYIAKENQSARRIEKSSAMPFTDRSPNRFASRLP